MDYETARVRDCLGDIVVARVRDRIGRYLNASVRELEALHDRSLDGMRVIEPVVPTTIVQALAFILRILGLLVRWRRGRLDELLDLRFELPDLKSDRRYDRHGAGEEGWILQDPLRQRYVDGSRPEDGMGSQQPRQTADRHRTQLGASERYPREVMERGLGPDPSVDHWISLAAVISGARPLPRFTRDPVIYRRPGKTR